MSFRSKVFSLVLSLGFASLVVAAMGTVGGTVAVVTEEHSLAGTVAKGAVYLERDGKEIELIADENGDFLASLQPGRYTLVRVFDANQRELRISPRQVRSFDVKKNGHTRFDVMVQPLGKNPAAHLRVPTVSVTDSFGSFGD